jgi:hypothetical protein
MSYQSVKNTMMEYIQDIKKPAETRGYVFSWMAEYSETNHIRMLRMVEILDEYSDGEDEVPKKVCDEVFKLGCEIHREGGMTSQQACFYILTNFFMIDNLNIGSHIQCMWDGAGDWRY